MKESPLLFSLSKYYNNPSCQCFILRISSAYSSFGWSIPFASGTKASAVCAVPCGNELLIVVLVSVMVVTKVEVLVFGKIYLVLVAATSNTPGEVIEVVQGSSLYRI